MFLPVKSVTVMGGEVLESGPRDGARVIVLSIDLGAAVPVVVGMQLAEATSLARTLCAAIEGELDKQLEAEHGDTLE